jgi:hypothetical protein
VLGDVPVVALTPESVSQALPAGVHAVRLSEPDERLETSLISRTGDPSRTVAAFVEIARSAFIPDRS